MDVKEQEMWDLFQTIDEDSNKSLSLEEVILFLKSIIDDIDEQHMENIFRNFDKSGDRSIDFEEFKVNTCKTNLINSAQSKSSYSKHFFFLFFSSNCHSV